MGVLDLDLLNPVEGDHALNAGRLRWWLTLPHLAGSTRYHDLMAGGPGSVGTGAAIVGTDRPGGYGHLACPGSAIAASAFTPTVAALSVACSVLFDSLPGGYRGVWRHDNWGSNGFYQVGSTLGAYNDNLVSPQNVVTGRWYRIGIAVAGVSGAIRWYLDGELVGTAAGVPNGYSSLGAGLIRLGGDTFSQWITGALDDIAVWNRPLSGAEFAADADQSRRGHPDTLRHPSTRAIFVLLGLAPRAAAGGLAAIAAAAGEARLGLAAAGPLATQASAAGSARFPLAASASASASGSAAGAASILLAAAGPLAGVATLAGSATIVGPGPDASGSLAASASASAAATLSLRAAGSLLVEASCRIPPGPVTPVSPPDLRRALIDFLRADATLLGLLGDRAEAKIRPQWRKRGDPLPDVTITVLARRRDHDIRRPTGTARSRAQVDIWAQSPARCAEIRDRVESLLDGFAGDLAGLRVGECRQLDEGDRPEWPGDGQGSPTPCLRSTFHIRHAVAVAR